MAIPKSKNFVAELKDFYVGFSPIAHLDSLTEKGVKGSASAMTNAYVLEGLLTQGPGLVNLTNGTQTAPGVVSELINHILDKPTADSVTYGIGATKLFKITPTTVTTGGTPSWPQAITNCTDGESVIQLGTNLYGFYNKSSGGDILKMPLSTEIIDPDWGSTTLGGAALQKAPHPVATKEDIMIFGNGQYVGVYFDGGTMDVDKLDFGTGYEVVDVEFFGNYWYIAVNGGTTGTNNITGQVYLYDGAATESILADETGVGIQKIGFLFKLNGVIYVAYQDLSSTGGYNMGYILGRQIKKIASFTGGLPSFAQKTLYQSTILFVAGGSLWSCGSISPDLPIQISQIADGGYTIVGALASPFGTPMVASTQSTSYQLSKFSGYDKTTIWKSVIIPTTFGRMKGYIDEVSVLTRALGATGSDIAGATMTIEAGQVVTTSNSKVITTAGKTRHIFDSFGIGAIEDFRVAINFANGSTTYPCKIRSIQIRGHYTES